MAALTSAIGVQAGDSFYYCGDQKITLQEEAGKEAVIMPTIPSNKLAVPSIKGGEIKDDRVVISVVTKENAKTMKAARSGATPLHMEKCYRDSQGLELVPTGYVNVRLKKEEDKALLERYAAEFGLQITEQNAFMPLWYELVLTFENQESVIDIANHLYETGDFIECSPAFSFDPYEISYDPDVYDQWGLCNTQFPGIDINIVPAWDYATGKGVKIAIIDGGVDINHRDLVDNIYKSYDGATGKSPATRVRDHGTHCAGIAAAVRNNGLDIAGVAPDAKLMVATFDDPSTNTIKNMTNCINWAWRNGADILSCSWTCDLSMLIVEAVDSAVTRGRSGKGCLIVKSAGNTGKGITFPGSLRKEVIAVGNIDTTGNRAPLSSHGEKLHVMAPGEKILSTMPNDQIGYKSGTSMACPHVSGVAALILQRNPTLTALQVREILAKSTNKVGDMEYSTQKEFGSWNEWYGYGLIDAYKAVMNTPRK